MSKIWIKKGQFGYSTKLKDNREPDTKMYLSIQFKQGLELPKENCQIELLESFVSCYKTKKGEIKPKLVIIEYNPIKK